MMQSAALAIPEHEHEHEPGSAPNDLIRETVDILTAAMSGGSVDVNHHDIAGLFKGIHSALLTASLEIREAVPAPDEPDESVMRDPEASVDPLPMLKELGIKLVGEVQAGIAPVPEILPVPVGNVIPLPRTREQIPVRHKLPSPEPRIATVTSFRPAKDTAVPPAVTAPQSPALPRRLKKIEDALLMDSIICLVDGKKVKDLGAHLETLGVTPDQYRREWGLPKEYPMRAPSHILKKGPTFEVDFTTGHKRPVR